MTSELINELLKQGLLFTVLAISGYILWNRYDKFTQRTQSKLDEAEKRIREYMENGYSKLTVMAETQQRIIADNTDAMKSIQRTMERHTKIMECVMTEIKEAREQRRNIGQ